MLHLRTTKYTLAFLTVLMGLSACGQQDDAISAQPHSAGSFARSALLVGDVEASSGGDEALKLRLEGMGFEVVVRSGRSASVADAQGRALVVISESVSSEDVRTKFRDTSVPVFLSEPSLLDDMGMTGPSWAKDFGDLKNQVNVVMESSAGLLGAGISGEVRATLAPQKYVWGSPSSSALRVATIAGHPQWLSEFAYDSGAAMASGRAPARRLFFFAGRSAPMSFSPKAWDLFEAAVSWLSQTNGILVAAKGPLSASDLALKSRLESLGLAVSVMADDSIVSATAERAKVIVISESTRSEVVQSKLTNIRTPIVALEPALFDDLGLTGGTWQRDFGDRLGQNTLSILAPQHPLAAGLTGSVTVTSSAAKFV